MVSATCATPAQQAQEVAAAEKPREQVVTQHTGEVLIHVQETMEAEQYNRALADMNSILKEHLSPFDRAKALELHGYIFAALDDYDRSAEDWEASLATEALPDYTILDMRYRLAQVYAALEDYSRALGNIEVWLAEAEAPGPEALFLAAQLYYVADRPQDALIYAERGLAKITEPRQSWWEVAVAIFYETDQYNKAVPLLEEMIVLWPEKKAYYTQLAGFYAEAEREFDYFNILEQAYLRGLLSKSGEMVRLAQLYRLHDEPRKAAELLESEMARGRVKSTEANRRVLSYAWLEAGEDEKAAAVLRMPDHLWRSPPTEGDNHFARCDMHYAAANWQAVIRSCLAALVQGGIDKSDVSMIWLYLGQAQTELGQFDDALRSLQNCMSYDNSKIQCANWLERATKELERPLTPIRWQAPDFWRVEASEISNTEPSL